VAARAPGGGGDPRIDWRTYSEARADFDRALEGLEGRLENRIRDGETRLMSRLDEQGRTLERIGERNHDGVARSDERVRVLEQKLAALESQNLADAVEDLQEAVTVLKTTNRLMAGGFTAAIGVLGVVIAALALWHH
jgi:hypothetical protein